MSEMKYPGIKGKTKAEMLDDLYSELSAYGKRISENKGEEFTGRVVAMAQRDTIFKIQDWLTKAMKDAWDEEMRENLSKKKKQEGAV